MVAVRERLPPDRADRQGKGDTGTFWGEVILLQPPSYYYLYFISLQFDQSGAHKGAFIYKTYWAVHLMHFTVYPYISEKRKATPTNQANTITKLVRFRAMKLEYH